MAFFGGQFFGGGFFSSDTAATSVDPGDKPPYRKSPHRGFRLEDWKKNRGNLEESLERTIERTWAELRGTAVEEEAERIVAPFVRTGEPVLPGEKPEFRVDWAALSNELRAVQALAEAHQRWMALRAEEARQKELIAITDEVITLLLLDA